MQQRYTEGRGWQPGRGRGRYGSGGPEHSPYGSRSLSDPYGDDPYFGGELNYGEGYGSGSRDSEYESSWRTYREHDPFERGERTSRRYGTRGSDPETNPYYGASSSYFERGPIFGDRVSATSGYPRDRRYPSSERGFQSDSDRYGERGWWDKTTDEISAWFGDEEAERRREMDHRMSGKYGNFRGRGPKGYTRSDERIKEDVNDRLTDYAYLDASDVEVDVTGGDVVLTGTVETRHEKRLAEDLAESVSGVRNVENRLRVNDSYSTSRSSNTDFDATDSKSKYASQN
jgi:osmotically-inducible protein OsmY